MTPTIQCTNKARSQALSLLPPSSTEREATERENENEVEHQPLNTPRLPETSNTSIPAVFNCYSLLFNTDVFETKLTYCLMSVSLKISVDRILVSQEDVKSNHLRMKKRSLFLFCFYQAKLLPRKKLR